MSSGRCARSRQQIPEHGAHQGWHLDTRLVCESAGGYQLKWQLSAYFTDTFPGILWFLQATWVEFKPPANAVDAESWRLSKLEYPILPMEVVYNGSQSMHVVDEQGVNVKAQESHHRLHVR